jgi:hypothetical protein
VAQAAQHSLNGGLVNRVPALITAVGALGTAAYGLVDTLKAVPFTGGGLSVRGMGYIKKTLTPFLPATSIGSDGSVLSRESVFQTLQSNWINGMASTDQQAIAKSLIKLRMDVKNTACFATLTGVDGDLLKSVVGKMVNGTALEKNETDAYGRFDLVLSTIINQAYERADQEYRNTAKLAAVPISVALAVCAAWMIAGTFDGAHITAAVVIGVVATPLAPIAKDLSSALQAGVKTMQAWKS